MKYSSCLRNYQNMFHLFNNATKPRCIAYKNEICLCALYTKIIPVSMANLEEAKR